jgi:hypothetical protein
VTVSSPPPIVARQRIGKRVPEEKNTNAVIKELLDAVFYMWSVSYEILNIVLPVVLSSHLQLRLPNSIFFSGFPTTNLYAFLSLARYMPHTPPRI